MPGVPLLDHVGLADAMLRRFVPPSALLLSTALATSAVVGSASLGVALLRLVAAMTLILPATIAIDRRWIGQAGRPAGAAGSRPRVAAMMLCAPAVIILPLVAASYLGCLPSYIAYLAEDSRWFFGAMTGLVVCWLLDWLASWWGVWRSMDGDAPRCGRSVQHFGARLGAALVILGFPLSGLVFLVCQPGAPAMVYVRPVAELGTVLGAVLILLHGVHKRYSVGANALFMLIALLLLLVAAFYDLPACVLAFLDRWPRAMALPFLYWPVALGLASAWFARPKPDPDAPRCHHCGYSLKGAPGPRCPECGSACEGACN